MAKSNDKPSVEIFTDGACTGNPGPGGFAAMIRDQKGTRELSGCERKTTNNRMEMRAAIEALRELQQPSRVKMVTDSQYLVNGITRWIFGWIKRNWVTSQQTPVLNRDLWETLWDLTQVHDIEWTWVKGHARHPENERCDRLARAAIETCDAAPAAPSPSWKETPAQWRDLCAVLPHGIFLLTTHDKETPMGMIASWVTQVSRNPELVLVAIHRDRAAHQPLKACGVFALHLLAEDHQQVMVHFKAGCTTGFEQVRWRKSEHGVPLLEEGCVLRVECRVTDTCAPGNHTLFVGEVLEIRTFSGAAPLTTMDYSGVYTGAR
jgi:ribonuclease HI